MKRGSIKRGLVKLYKTWINVDKTWITKVNVIKPGLFKYGLIKHGSI